MPPTIIVVFLPLSAGECSKALSHYSIPGSSQQYWKKTWTEPLASTKPQTVKPGKPGLNHVFDADSSTACRLHVDRHGADGRLHPDKTRYQTERVFKPSA